MEKNKYYQELILEYLIDSPQTSVKKISENVNLSEKTVRNYVDLINDYLVSNNLGFIEKIPGKGIFCNINDNVNISDLIVNNHSSSVTLSDDIRKSIIKELLIIGQDNYITQKKLSEKLYVSLPTLRKEIHYVEIWLEKNNLKLITVQNKGMHIEGDEISYRQAVRTYILEDGLDKVRENLYLFLPGLDIESYIQIIRTAEEIWKIQFSSDSLYRIWIMLCLAVYRSIKFPLNKLNYIDDIEKFNEYNFSETVFNLVYEFNGRNYSEDEKQMLCYEILISSKLLWSENETLKSNKVLVNLEEFVSKVIFLVSDVLGIDLTTDNILMTDLMEHLKSAIFRMKYGKNKSEEISKQLKQNYNKVYLSVWSTSQLFEEYYNIRITESEVSYIVLYIESALMRRQNEIEVIYITDQSRSQSHFVAEILKQNIPKINNVKIIRNMNKNRMNSTMCVYVTDYEIDEDISIKISKVPTSHDLENVRSTIEKIESSKGMETKFSKSIQGLFDPSLIITNVNVEDRKDLLKMMGSKLEQLGYVSTNFFETVWEREEETSTCVGNRTAIPHGAMREVNEPKIAVATLTKPVQWTDGEKVQLVFLLAAKMNSQVNIDRIKTFYSNLIQLTENKQLMAELMLQENGKDAYNLLFNLEGR